MTAHTGLGASSVPGTLAGGSAALPTYSTAPVGTSPLDARLAYGALYGARGQCFTGGGVSTSASSMNVTVAQGVWGIVDPTNTAGLMIVPTDTSTLTPSPGAASTRIDSIYVTQSNWENDAGTGRSAIGIATGTAGSGSAAAIPTGALLIATLNVPAGITNSAQGSITLAAAATNLAALPVAAASSAALGVIAGAFTGQMGYAAGTTYRWNGTVWKPWNSDWAPFFFNVGGVNGSYNASPGWLPNPGTGGSYRYADGLVRYRGSFILNGGTAASTAQLNVTAPVAAATTVGAQATGTAYATNSSDTNATYYLNIGLGTGGTPALYFLQGGGAKAAAATGSVPFGEPWGQSDAVTWDVTYDPA